MDAIQLIKDSLSDPANQIFLTIVALGFFVIALIFAFVGRRKKIAANNRGVAIGGNNSGVVTTGDVSGNINASVSTPGNQTEAKEPPSMWLLNLMAALSAIVSAVFAALAYFLPPTGP